MFCLSSDDGQLVDKLVHRIVVKIRVEFHTCEDSTIIIEVEVYNIFGKWI